MDRKEHDIQRLQALLRKYAEGTLSPMEQGLLESWYNQHVPQSKPVDETTVNRHLQRLSARLPIRKPRPNFIKWLPYAAAIIIATVAAGWLFFGNLAIEKSQLSNQDHASAVILPGGNRATLTLADGRTIDLSAEQAGIVIAEGISYRDGSDVFGGSVNQGVSDETRNLTTSHVHMLALTTPKGGTYQVTLPDGSNVWLNAGSTLKYPSRFSAQVREIFLEGEAYFDIRPAYQTGGHQQSTDGKDLTADRLPFRVVTKGQTVEVLGTEFNISAYPDESSARTTLVEGSVAVVNLNSKAVSQLRAGEQSIVHGAETQVRQVDTAPFTAWKSGLFLFKQTGIHEVMNQLSRWYDIAISFEDGIPAGETFSGKMGRDVQLVNVLDFLSGSGINYRLEGRTLIIEGLNYR